MSSNAEFALRNIRGQVENLYVLLEERRHVAQAALVDVVAQLHSDGSLDDLSKHSPLYATSSRTAMPSTAANWQGALRQELVLIQGRGSKYGSDAVEADFSKPLASFAHQLGDAQGRVDVDVEANGLNNNLRGRMERRLDSFGGETLSEAQMDALKSELTDMTDRLIAATRPVDKPIGATDSPTDEIYREAYSFGVSDRISAWYPVLHRFERTVETITEMSKPRKAAVRAVVAGAADVVVNVMGDLATVRDKQTNLGRLAKERDAWDRTTEQLAVWTEVGRVLPEAWSKYLASPDGQALLSTFGFKPGTPQAEMVEQVCNAAAGQEIERVRTVADRGSSEGPSP